MISVQAVLGVILAGGLGRRMGGGDKPMTDLGGRSILDHVLERARPQCNGMIINANGDPGRFQHIGLPVVPDGLEGNPGPLAGVLAAMDWAAINAPEMSHIMSFAGDAPFIPRDLVEKLLEPLAAGADMARAKSFGQRHPVFAVWPVSIRADLRDKLVNHEMRKIDLYTSAYDIKEVDFSGVPDPFFNINTPEDRDEAVRILSARRSS
ncbi:MAG: molybdenum cofactor guanylyltransferase MobA [Alphaproteobacteria bacterium]|nr:molybdenum cofactor guanylyltransferase MobA [Alphaproteobacteria bacterium]